MNFVISWHSRCSRWSLNRGNYPYFVVFNALDQAWSVVSSARFVYVLSTPLPFAFSFASDLTPALSMWDRSQLKRAT